MAKAAKATAEAEAPAPKKGRKAKAAAEELPAGLTTREAAEQLGITPVKLRRILRTDDFQNDKSYTRYRLDEATMEQLKAAIAAGNTGEKKPRKSKKAAAVEDTAEEVSEELAELDEEEEEVAELDFDDEEEDE